MKDTPGKYVICGIGTEVGKTIVSAILTEALQADYWKPVQSGGLEHTDTDTVRSLISNTQTVLHPESYRLKLPMSPHAAAEADGMTIDPDRLQVPVTTRPLIIELAGGIMVPLNRQLLNLHLLQRWHLPVILVSRYYLGSINHTLLSLEVLRQYKIPVAGIVFNGEENIQSMEAILSYTQVPLLGSVRQETSLTKEVIRQYAVSFQPKIYML